MAADQAALMMTLCQKTLFQKTTRLGNQKMTDIVGTLIYPSDLRPVGNFIKLNLGSIVSSACGPSTSPPLPPVKPLPPQTSHKYLGKVTPPLPGTLFTSCHGWAGRIRKSFSRNLLSSTKSKIYIYSINS